jgi:hypothetical protein
MENITLGEITEEELFKAFSKDGGRTSTGRLFITHVPDDYKIEPEEPKSSGGRTGRGFMKNVKTEDLARAILGTENPNVEQD